MVTKTFPDVFLALFLTAAIGILIGVDLAAQSDVA
jgi:hypothetical protein